MNLLMILIITLILSAFFAGMEAAFVSSNKLRIELNRKQGKFSSGIIEIFINHPDQYLSTMTVGYFLALAGYGFVMVYWTGPAIGNVVSSDVLTILIQLLIAIPVFFLLSEYLPKLLFRIDPNTMLDIFAVPAFIFYILFYPVIWIIKGVAEIILRIFTGKKPVSDTGKENIFGKINWDGFSGETQAIASEEQDTEHEIKIFQNALDFSSVKIRDCMIPRTDIVAIEEDASIEELKQKFIDTGVSKIIVYKEDIDNIIGYIHSKELFKNPASMPTLINPLTFVPETMSGNKMMQLFMQEHRSIAIVVDEYGGTSGLLTLEDLMEEIFGDIEDEHDRDNLVDQKISETEYLFSGRLEIEYLNETYNLNIPEKDDYDTLAGFILYHHLDFPLAGEKIEIAPYTFIIRKMSNTRIDLVQMNIHKK